MFPSQRSSLFFRLFFLSLPPPFPPPPFPPFSTLPRIPKGVLSFGWRYSVLLLFALLQPLRLVADSRR